MSALRTVTWLTWRLLLGRRRWLALIVCNGLPVLIAWLFAVQIETFDLGLIRDFLAELVPALVITILLPLSAVVFGTSAFGNEIDDGTLTYLLAKPTTRRWIVAAKWIAAAGATALANVPGVVLAGWILTRNPFDPLVRGFGAGVLVASGVYVALFLALSLYTRRALIFGLIYVLGWEGALSRLFAGTRTFSVREYATSISGETLGSLDLSTALGMSGAALALGVALAIRRLERLEITQDA